MADRRTTTPAGAGAGRTRLRTRLPLAAVTDSCARQPVLSTAIRLDVRRCADPGRLLGASIAAVGLLSALCP